MQTKKLGVAYNVWDAEELLKGSIKAIRNCVDFIVVVYQEVSNFGEMNPDLAPVLFDLVADGLIDRLIKYEPRPGQKPQDIETMKHQVGLDICKLMECDYFLQLDSDEYYDEKQFRKAFDFIVKHEIDHTAVCINDYYKYPNVRLRQENNYYAPFISKIYPHTQYVLQGNTFCLMDPTRRLEIDIKDKKEIFPPDMITMEHYTYVRKDIRRKLRNSTAYDNYFDQLEKIALYHDEYLPVRDALLAGVELQYIPIEYAANKFNIKI